MGDIVTFYRLMDQLCVSEMVPGVSKMLEKVLSAPHHPCKGPPTTLHILLEVEVDPTDPEPCPILCARPQAVGVDNFNCGIPWDLWGSDGIFGTISHLMPSSWSPGAVLVALFNES